MLARLRSYLPNILTFGSIALGLVSIIMASRGFFLAAGFLIFGSFIMDALDGIIARYLEVQSEFGMQLDSLADMVGLGIAPLLLLFHHINSRGTSAPWIIPFLIFTACASAFRLARFNLLPPKKDNQKESIGLSLFHTALTITVAVLSDLTFPAISVPTWIYAGLLLIFGIFMVSKLSFPPLPWFFSSKQKTIIILLCYCLCLLFFPPLTSLLLFCIAHLSFSIGRALYIEFNKGVLAR